jgi:hypothetical protein
MTKTQLQVQNKGLTPSKQILNLPNDEDPTTIIQNKDMKNPTTTKGRPQLLQKEDPLLQNKYPTTKRRPQLQNKDQTTNQRPKTYKMKTPLQRPI